MAQQSSTPLSQTEVAVTTQITQEQKRTPNHAVICSQIIRVALYNHNPQITVVENKSKSFYAKSTNMSVLIFSLKPIKNKGICQAQSKV